MKAFVNQNGHLEMVWLTGGENSLKICLLVSTQYTNVTDGRTDTAGRQSQRLQAG